MARVKSKNAGAKEGFETADRLHSAAIHLLRRLRVRDRESGVGPAQLSALSVLVFGGPRSLGELADAEQVRPPTMSRIVAGLERAGLVKRRKTEDGRRVRLERGWVLRYYGVRAGLGRKVLAGMNPASYRRRMGWNTNWAGSRKLLGFSGVRQRL